MKARLKKFWKDHIIDDFPYPAKWGPRGEAHFIFWLANWTQTGQTRHEFSEPTKECMEAPMSNTKEFVWAALTVIMFLIIVTLLFGAIGG